MRFIKEQTKQIFALLLVIVMVITSIQMSPAKMQAATKAKLVATYDGDGFEVTYKVTSQWSGAFNADVTIKNTSDKIIDNWAIGFSTPYEITKIWNGVINSYEENIYEIKNAGSNQDIAVGQSVSFGFTAKANGEIDLPSDYELLCYENTVSQESLEISYKVTNDWKSAFNGEIRIKNISNETIEDWRLRFDFDHKIDRFWTAEILRQDGNRYYIKNAGYNANIKPGETVILGFSGNPGKVKSEPQNYELSQITQMKGNSNDSVDNAEESAAQVDRKKAEESLKSWNNPSLPILEGEFRTVFDKAQDYYTNGQKLENKEQYKEAKDAYQESWMLLEKNKAKLDEINALLTDLRANPNLDYDKDKLLNGFEIDAFCGYLNPIDADTDSDGINDGEDDYDLDGLSNLEEQKYGTSPIDTDTDGDDISDKREIDLGLDPLLPYDGNTSLEQVIVSNDTGVKIKINAQGDAEGKVSVDISETNIESTNAIAPLYEINSDVEFSTAELNIPVDLSNIPAEDYDKLYVVYYDEELGGFIPLENSVVDTVNGCVSATVNHFSLYSVFYVKNWESYFAVPFNQPKSTTENQFSLLDIMLILDSSGSMDWNDPYDYRKVAAKSFVDALLPGAQVGVVVGDRAGVVDFDSYATLKQPLTDDFEAVKRAIDNIDASGGTDIGAGVNVANDELITNSEDDRLKIEILLTDGDGSYSSSYTNEAIANGIVIYTIGLGSEVDSSLLSEIAQSTGGQYFHVSNASELPVVYSRIKEITTEPQDSDNDGISDSLEVEGMRTGSLSSNLIYTDPNVPDSDGDGLLDGEEILVGNPSEVTVLGLSVLKWYKMNSNPNEADTDNDNLSDYDEVNVYHTNPNKADSDSDKLNDYLECKLCNTNPNSRDTDKDTFNDGYEFLNLSYDPLVFDNLIKADGNYIVRKNKMLVGRIHIQSPIVVNSNASLTLENINKIFIGDIKSQATWESNVITVYGSLFASDDSTKELVYDGSGEWTGIFVRGNGYASLKNFALAGMVSAIYVGEGALLDIRNSEINNCFEGITTTYASNDGTIVNISDTNFLFNEDAWNKSYPAVNICGNTNYSHSGGTIDNFATGIILSCAGKENKIQNIKITNGYSGIYLDDSKANISNVTLDKNSIGLEAYGHLSNAYLENSYVWNSDDYGIKMGKQAAVYTYNNIFYGNNTDIKNNFLKDTFLSLAMSLIPFGIGDGVDLISSIYGRDIFTDEALSSFERGLGFICLGEIKKVDNIIDTGKLVSKLPNGVRYLDAAASLATRYGDEFVSILNKFDSKTVNSVLELYQKYGDSFAEIFIKYSDDGVELLVSKHGREAIDLIGKLGDDAIAAIKYNDNLLGKYSKLDNIEAFASETAALAKELNCKAFTKSNYLDAMKKSFGWKTSKKLGKYVQAHHLFPVEFFGKNGKYAKLLSDAGINFCDPRLISWYDKSTHLSNAKSYNEAILKVIKAADNDVTKLIDGVREVARIYGFEPKF